MHQLSGLDAMFINMEMQGFPMHVSSLSIYDPVTSKSKKLVFNNLLKLFAIKIKLNDLAILRKRLITVPGNLDCPYWQEDKNFDIHSHVKHVALPEPNDWQTLCSMVADIHAQPLRTDRPLWEAYVIEGLKNIEGIPPNAFALMIKMHHSIMDGRTGLAIYSNLHSFTPDAHENLPYGNSAFGSMGNNLASRNAESDVESDDNDDSLLIKLDSNPGVASLLNTAYINNIKKTANLAKLCGKGISLYSKVQWGLHTNKFKTLVKPKTRFNGTISSRRNIDRLNIPLDSIRMIKDIFKPLTINDVALTIIGGALRKYLQTKVELPLESLIAGIPVDPRASNDSASSGAKVNFMNVALRTDVEVPIERLYAVYKEAQASKVFTQALGENLVNDVLENLYSNLVSGALKTVVDLGILEKMPPINNTVVTNVRGYPCPMFIAGSRLIESFGMGPLIPNTGLFHTVTTCCDSLTIGITVCQEMMKDTDFYIACLRESYQELLNGVIAYNNVKQGQSTAVSNTILQERATITAPIAMDEVIHPIDEIAHSQKSITLDKKNLPRQYSDGIRSTNGANRSNRSKKNTPKNGSFVHQEISAQPIILEAEG